MKDPGYQIRCLPALAPSRDPGFPWLIRMSPINRTRKKSTNGLKHKSVSSLMSVEPMVVDGGWQEQGPYVEPMVD